VRWGDLGLHGVRMGAPGLDVFDEEVGEWRRQDRVFEVFDPPWWRVGAWARWFWMTRVRKVPSGRITVLTASGATRSYRAFAPPPPRRIPVESRVRSRLGF